MLKTRPDTRALRLSVFKMFFCSRASQPTISCHACSLLNSIGTSLFLCLLFGGGRGSRSCSGFSTRRRSGSSGGSRWSRCGSNRLLSLSGGRRRRSWCSWCSGLVLAEVGLIKHRSACSAHTSSGLAARNGGKIQRGSWCRCIRRLGLSVLWCLGGCGLSLSSGRGSGCNGANGFGCWKRMY